MSWLDNCTQRQLLDILDVVRRYRGGQVTLAELVSDLEDTTDIWSQPPEIWIYPETNEFAQVIQEARSAIVHGDATGQAIERLLSSATALGEEAARVYRQREFRSIGSDLQSYQQGVVDLDALISRLWHHASYLEGVATESEDRWLLAFEDATADLEYIANVRLHNELPKTDEDRIRLATLLDRVMHLVPSESNGRDHD